MELARDENGVCIPVKPGEVGMIMGKVRNDVLSRLYLSPIPSHRYLEGSMDITEETRVGAKLQKMFSQRVIPDSCLGI